MNLENIKSTTTWAEASGTMNNNNAKITEAIERLESAVEEGGSGGTADSVDWNKVTGKPSWITDSKPVYAKEDLSQGVQTSLDKADTALQAIPDGYATEEYTQNQVRHILNLMSTALEGKVDKVDGKQLSTEDFTTELKETLEAISSSGGGGVDSEALQALSDRLDLIVSGGTSGVIDSFIDVISFLTGINDSVKLKDMLDTLRESVYRKQDAITDLDAIRSGASLGATAVQRDALSGYVDLETDQTVLGAKTFSDSLALKNDVWILAASNNRFINFTASTDKVAITNSWRLGYWGTETGDKNYFLLQSTGRDASFWKNALRVWSESLLAEFGGNVSAPKFITNGGTSSQFVKGDGSLDNTSYATKTELGEKTDEDGVFIMFHRNSDNYPLMVKPEKWKSYQDSGEIAEGVVIVEGGRMLVVAPTETSLYWSSAAVSGGGKTTTDRQLALIDFEGKSNTNKQNTHEECSSVNYANGYCAQYSRVNANGDGLTAGKWWLPSLGELIMICANMRKVNYALSLINDATQLSEKFYWSSTESSVAYAWGLNLNTSYAYARTKVSGQGGIRPVSAFYKTEDTTIMPWSEIVSSPNLSEFTSQLNNVASAVFATSAEEASILQAVRNSNDFSGTELNKSMRLYGYVERIAEGLFPASNNANAVLTVNRYPGNYNSQIGFSGNGNLYYRCGNGGELTTQPWSQIAFTSTKVDAAASADKIETTEWIVGSHESAPFVIRSLTYGGNVITCNHEGKVGVGTNDPTHTLTVNGTASISGDTTIGGTTTLRDVRMSDAIAISMGVGTTISEDYALSVGGDVSVSGYVMTEGVSMYSQRSLKDVVDEDGLSLEELATIKPTRFTWKDGRDGRVHIGGIADDVQKVLPEAVRETPEGILTMDYPVASFAVASSLVKPVTNHEERIAELERENKQLREELEMIKRYIGYGNDK